MKTSLHSSVESAFDHFSIFVTRIIGSSITFIVALIIVLYWVLQKEFWSQDLHSIIRDALLAVTFLSFFIVQKSVNRYSAALHLKVNELIASHDKASNKVVNIEGKTEEEIRTMAKDYENLEDNDNSKA